MNGESRDLGGSPEETEEVEAEEAKEAEERRRGGASASRGCWVVNVETQLD